MVEQWATGTEDTIALLQEEIQRLENEVRLRDETIATATRPIAPEPGASNAERDRRVSELTSDVAKRDETIALLLEQVRLLEEAESASRAEWEQLNQWVEEVERRVEGRDNQGRDFAAELDAERRKAEAQRLAAETDRRTWETHRKALEKEVAQLRTKLADVARRPEGGSRAALDALEQENNRLRETCRELERHKATAAQADYFRGRLEEVQVELGETQRQIRVLNDERDRERNEFAAEMAALRSQLARESLHRQTETSQAAEPEALTIDERIQALRLHLKEIHEREEQERKENRLSARLSRLWNHTGPKR